MDYHQAQPQRTGINLNISETVDAAVTLIKEAADGGADVVTVPELWFSRVRLALDSSYSISVTSLTTCTCIS